MKRFALALLLVGVAVWGQEEKPLKAFPYTPGLDLSAMDRTADACVDFYQYSCGGWQKNNPIPSDQARWSVYGKLAKDNQQYLWGILEELAAKKEGRKAGQQKIGDLFAACMDEEAVERRGVKDLPYWAWIDGMKTKQDLPRVLAKLYAAMETPRLFFGFGANQDFQNSQSVIAFVTAGGLGLPDRDYYTKDDEKSVVIRKQYVAHVAKMLALLGDTPEVAAKKAARVLEVETALAKATLTRVEQRDPYKSLHKMGLKALQAMTPHFVWSGYLAELGVAGPGVLNVTQPEFMKALDGQLAAMELGEIQTYLRWHTVSALAPFLPKVYGEENFDFYSKTLRGVPKLAPRWKRCVELVDRQLGEALGQEFVERTFQPELKEKTLLMARQIEAAMEEDIKGLSWMSAATKKKALEKLHTLVNKIGYPDKWRDYGAVEIRRDDLVGNVERATRVEGKRKLAKIGKPLDRGEWSMTPPTVNAYYDPQMNDINFPAGVLQPPLYDPKMDDAPNYGNTGGTIGHELTHAFDDEGRQFDAKGNLKQWWTKDDEKRFTERAQCIVDQYAQYTVVDDIKINSKLTLGEDIADLGGLILAWMAWKVQTKGQQLQPQDGMTPEQRFFVGYAQWACENDRPENLRVSAVTDPHSPGKYRVNGLMPNLEEFQKAFSCKQGQPMVKENRCRIW